MEPIKRPWHVNAISNGRIVGDASLKAEKYLLNGANHTIATVYHGVDADLIVRAVNSYEAQLEALKQAAAALAVIANHAEAKHPGCADQDNLASIRGFAHEAFLIARKAISSVENP